jgi:hypothetical protein
MNVPHLDALLVCLQVLTFVNKTDISIIHKKVFVWMFSLLSKDPSGIAETYGKCVL